MKKFLIGAAVVGALLVIPVAAAIRLVRDNLEYAAGPAD